MQSHTILYGKARASFNFGTKPNPKLGSTSPSEFPTIIPGRTHVRSYLIRAKIPSCHAFERSVNQAEMTDEDDDLCPVECVREFKTDEELFRILETAKKRGSLVVVDFFRTSCGSCKYIEQGFSKLCKGAGNGEAGVIFLKHNVIDEYDEQSEVAERLRIKTVPLFHFYKDGILLEAFPTRDKERINAAISKYTSPASEEDDA
ncbi:PREDICTED: thioredoxin [Prunus dulcis]|uniref:PREDICTED: thioredoxin n=1 Tax=Prunus dulcis TaxID=3755 RepID=A0A5E4E8G7_PRUDU|nr:thioredoxin-like 4, chloroplastic [Prunus dulcis]VVA12093.1 PREDICTED: thioredoxin [Prunus dulcis]